MVDPGERDLGSAARQLARDLAGAAAKIHGATHVVQMRLGEVREPSNRDVPGIGEGEGLVPLPPKERVVELAVRVG